MADGTLALRAPSGGVPRVARRTALALMGLGAFAACGRSSVAPAPPAQPDLPLRLSTRWSAHPDGPLPSAGDEGTPLVPILAGSTVFPAVVGGALVGNLPADRAAAAYLTQALGTGVTRLGARFGFGAGDDSGSVALVAWNGSPSPRGQCHMVFTPSRWIAGVLDDGGVVELASEDYRSALPQDGTPLRVDVQLREGTATLVLPDGSGRAVSDARLAARDGSVAVWEFYKNDAGSATTLFYETWAG